MMNRGRSIGQAVSRRPFRVPFSRWPWRALGYLLTSIPLALGFFLTALVLVVSIAGIPFLGMPLAAAERYRARWLDPAAAASARRAPGEPGLAQWARFQLRQPGNWREFGYAILFAGLWLADAVVAVSTAGALLLFGGAPLWLWLLPGGHINLGAVDIRTPGQAWWMPLAALAAWPVLAFAVAQDRA